MTHILGVEDEGEGEGKGELEGEGGCEGEGVGEGEDYGRAGIHQAQCGGGGDRAWRRGSSGTLRVGRLGECMHWESTHGEGDALTSRDALSYHRPSYHQPDGWGRSCMLDTSQGRQGRAAAARALVRTGVL